MEKGELKVIEEDGRCARTWRSEGGGRRRRDMKEGRKVRSRSRIPEYQGDEETVAKRKVTEEMGTKKERGR